MVHTRTRKSTQFVVLPPSWNSVPKRFRRLEVNNRRYDDLLAEMQRFRGRVYVSDGAVRSDELTADGRHKVAVDDCSWHVLSLDEQGQVCACLRYLEESCAVAFDDLWVRHAAMADSPMGGQFRRAVELQMAEARRMQLGFGEVGGWAVAEDHRGTLEGLRIILATYGLLELLGSCTGVATATFRHHSATMLRRIGLSSLSADGVDLPPYFDPRYGCQMEVLRFDSRFPNPKYRDWVAELRSSLTATPVICREKARPNDRAVPRGFEVPSLAPALLPDLVPSAGIAWHPLGV
jgi:hypothetical protein